MLDKIPLFHQLTREQKDKMMPALQVLQFSKNE
jgi:signal-transduction protein with cAMP-binding, CBS, and nucleotidyltransferase domain